MSTRLGLLFVFLLTSVPLHADDAVTISDATLDGDGIRTHAVRSPYQSKPTLIRVLTPNLAHKPSRVVYVLPVEANREQRYGDGLSEILKLKLHTTHNVVFVAPTFAQLPWYADHPTKPEVRQESYFLKVVVPFVDSTYLDANTKLRERLLVGFSKSGWGAWSLMLRNPELFTRAVAWDAPLMMDRPGKYGSGDIFGTVEQFERYQVSRLLEAKAEQFRAALRLFHFGYGNFRHEHEQVDALIRRLKIASSYRDGPHRKHDWHSGWVMDAVTWALSPTSAN